MSQGTTKICSLKLFVDKRSHKVLFAEASKEFVDLLFGLLSFPIGWAFSLRSVGKHVRAGSCLGNVYDSVEDFATTDLLPDFQNNKESILRPRRSPISTGGYVKGTTAYMVLDDLTVKPMNTLSVVAITNKLKIEDVSNVEELVVDVGIEECAMLAITSLHSKTALTDVFFKYGKKGEEHRSEASSRKKTQV